MLTEGFIQSMQESTNEQKCQREIKFLGLPANPNVFNLCHVVVEINKPADLVGTLQVYTLGRSCSSTAKVHRRRSAGVTVKLTQLARMPPQLVCSGERPLRFLFVKAFPGNGIDGGCEVAELNAVCQIFATEFTPRDPEAAIDHGDMFLVAGHRLSPTQLPCPPWSASRATLEHYDLSGLLLNTLRSGSGHVYCAIFLFRWTCTRYVSQLY